MTTTQAAERLGLTSRTIKDYCHREILAAEKHGRDWWITAAEVARYARERRPVGRPAPTPGAPPDSRRK